MNGLTLTIGPRDRVLYVSVAGEFSLDEAKRTFRGIIESIRANRSEKVYFDGRRIVGSPEVIERFYYGEYVADEVNALENSAEYEGSPQFAYVLNEPVLDPQRLGETVALNRGVNVKAFNNTQDAIAWLGVEPDSQG